MSNFGKSTIVIEGANAKKVQDFLNQMVKDSTFKYQIEPLGLSSDKGKSYITWSRSDDPNQLFIILTTKIDDITFAGGSYDIALKYKDDRLIIFCSYGSLNALRYLIYDLICNNPEDGKLYFAEWSEADCYTGCRIFDDDQKYFFIDNVKNYFGDDDDDITEVIDYKDKDLEHLVKDLINDQTLYL